MNRRRFLTHATGILGATATVRLSPFAFAGGKDNANPHAIVVLFLRGGCDGLHLLSPAGDSALEAARPADLRVTAEGEERGHEIKGATGNPSFLLHHEAKPLAELFQSKNALAIHACGLTNGTRSHFEAEAMMERGAAETKLKALSTGWLARYLAQSRQPAVLRAIAASDTLPGSLFGCPDAVAIPSPNDFAIDGGKDHAEILRALYADGATDMHKAGQEALRALETIQTKLKRDKDGNLITYEAAAGSYGQTSLSNAFETVAWLLRSGLGLRVATVDYGGWDTHENQNGTFSRQVGEMSEACAAFVNDMRAAKLPVTLIVMSEFGRRVKSNESQGTDHGHGNVMFVLGEGLKRGGLVHGKWPGLDTAALDDGADLAITTDYRAVLCDVLASRTGMAGPHELFPDYAKPDALGIV